MNRVGARDASIYIPVRNAGRTLPAALDSVRAQTVVPAEFFLVVDQRSTDDSLEICRASGLRIVEQEDGRLGHARNLAIQACRTPWLASCDSDVTLEPGWLEALLCVATERVAAVGGRTEERLFTAGDRWRAVNMPHNWGPAAFDNPFMLVSEMLANVAALRSIGGYRADLQSWEDSDTCQRLRHAGFTLRYEPGALAHHDRRDSVESVLDLRWFYASYRQRARLESLPGLISKFAVNRVYCLQGLSQTLHSEHPGTCAVALLLWFHHAWQDLNCALEKWPLLDERSRTRCLALLHAETTTCLTGPWADLHLPLQRLLPRTESAALRPTPNSALSGLEKTRGFCEYLAAARNATRALLAEMPVALVATLIRSAHVLADSDGEGHFPVPHWEVSAAQRKRLATQPLQPAWNWNQLRDTLRTIIDDREPIEAGRVTVCEPHLEEEGCAPGVDETAFGEVNARSTTVLLPHLEAAPAPAEMLRAALRSADLAVVAYQPPRIFIPAVPILNARDLASQCAAAGFRIRHFHTEAGLTRLVVQRAAGPQECHGGLSAAMTVP